MDLVSSLGPGEIKLAQYEENFWQPLIDVQKAELTAQLAKLPNKVRVQVSTNENSDCVVFGRDVRGGVGQLVEKQ